MVLDSIGEDRRALRHEETRRTILRVAADLADRDGIAGLTLREVARTVGMRAPSLYTYFESKNAVLDALFAEGYQALFEEQRRWRLVSEHQEPLEALTTGISNWITFCQQSVGRYQLMFTNAVPGWHPSEEAYAASRLVFDGLLVYLTRLGIRGTERIDLTTAVMGGLASQQLANDPNGDRWRRLAPAAARMLLAAGGDPK